MRIRKTTTGQPPPQVRNIRRREAPVAPPPASQDRVTLSSKRTRIDFKKIPWKRKAPFIIATTATTLGAVNLILGLALFPATPLALLGLGTLLLGAGLLFVETKTLPDFISHDPLERGIMKISTAFTLLEEKTIRSALKGLGLGKGIRIKADASSVYQFSEAREVFKLLCSLRPIYRGHLNVEITSSRRSKHKWVSFSVSAEGRKLDLIVLEGISVKN